ncbi:MAG TPA: hypothetical protein PKD05_05660 [Candidatus Melainabacteria bacterium]|nr:hypothetical protein [Candidatus Melainabacteria bacterium]
MEKDVPHEIEYLKRHDNAMQQLMDTIEMPNRMAENFIMFMRQNDWTLPKKRRNNEFRELTDSELEALQAIVREAFDGFEA